MSDAVLRSDAADAPAPPPGPRLAPVPAITGAPRSVDLAGLTFTLSPRRQTIDPDHVRTLAGLFTHLPPIVVHAPSSAVIDGVHRVMAARSLGLDTISAVAFRGSEDEAAILAVTCNVTHGKPLTVREREVAAAGILRSHPDWSDRRVAATCGLSPKTVGAVRGRAAEEFPQLRGRVGRDGRVRPVDPSAQRQRIADALAADPSASTRQIAARTGAAQGTVRDVRTRLDHGRPVVPSAADRSEAPAPRAAPPLGDDEAYRTSAVSAAFVEWFDGHVVRDDEEWLSFVAAVPVGRVYEIADAARRCSESWQRLAAAMEARARRRRDGSAQPE